MEYEGCATIPASRADAWDPITDPEVLTSCIMGAQEVTRISERKYEGLIQQSVAGITVSMEGEVEILEMDRPERLTFSGTGSDSRTGSRMDADVEVHLREDDDEVVMNYAVDITFTGKLATLGSRILKRQVKANVDTYFDNLVEYITENQ
jgi:carbon monoxide dehydrogenase subunit G